MDKKMFFVFYKFTTSRKRFSKAVLFLDRACPYVFVTIFAVFCGWLLYGRMFNVLLLFAGVPLATLIFARVVRFVVKRQRPCQKFNLSGPHAHKSSYSFPSNHAASASAIAFGCLYVDVLIGTAVFCVAVVTALSRLFTGAHYPSDVCAGFILGAVAAAVGFNVIPNLLL